MVICLLITLMKEGGIAYTYPNDNVCERYQGNGVLPDAK